MKRIKYFLLISLFIPFIVHADMGFPSSPSYEAVTKNPNGIETDGKIIPGNTVVTVTYEMYFSDYTDCYIEEYDVGVDCSELVPANTEFDMNDAIKKKRIVKLSKPKTGLVYNPDGVSIYKAPSVMFDTVGTIPPNTTVTYTYIDGDEPDDDRFAIWIYVQYDGKSGWLFILDKNVLIESELKESFTGYPTSMMDGNYKKIATIPKLTKYKILYATDAWSGQYYIEYNGEKGFVLDYDIPYKKDGTIGLKKDFHLLRDANVEDLNVLETLKSGTTYDYTYILGDYGLFWYYIKTPAGNEGWLYLDFEIDRENVILDGEEYVKEPVRTTTKKTTTTTTSPNEVEEIEPDEETPTIEGEIIKYILIAAVVVLSAVVILLLINRKKLLKINSTIEFGDTSDTTGELIDVSKQETNNKVETSKEESNETKEL